MPATVTGTRSDIAGIGALLVRPDGHVAWASDVTDLARCKGELRGALAHWCGAAKAGKG